MAYQLYLVSMCMSTLMQNMGVKEESHQNAILVCIDELRQTAASSSSAPSSCRTANRTDPSSAASACSAPHSSQCSACTTNHQHRLVDATFHNLERCDKCNKYPRGLLHQGFLCHSCGLIAHRTCSATGLPACQPATSDKISRVYQNSGQSLQ